MATPTVTRITDSHQAVSPFVIPIASIPPQEITQFEMAALLSLRNRARQLEQQIATAERSIRARLESGATVEAGEHAAELKESFRRNVAWRDVVVRVAERLYGEDRGEAYCTNVLRNTKPTRTVSLVLL
jgi:hypothetical protein